DPTDHRELGVRQSIGEAVQEISNDKARDVQGEQPKNQDRPLRQIEETEQQADDEPWQERRTDTAVKVGAEQGREGQQFDRHQGRKLQIAGPLVDERKGPEQTDADDNRGADKPGLGIAEIEKDADGLRKCRPEQVCKYEILRQTQL